MPVPRQHHSTSLFSPLQPPLALARQRQTPIYFLSGRESALLAGLNAAALFLDTYTNNRSNSNTAPPAALQTIHDRPSVTQYHVRLNSASLSNKTILARQPELNWKREEGAAELGRERATFGQGRSVGRSAERRGASRVGGSKQRKEEESKSDACCSCSQCSSPLSPFQPSPPLSLRSLPWAIWRATALRPS